MPTYEYECEKCRKSFELVQSMKDKSLTSCPKSLCRQKTTWGKGRVKRKIGAGAGIIFKGSGFYITDYRSEGYLKSKTDSNKAKETASDSAPKTESTKTDSAKAEKHKPAAKPAAKSES